jgi:hypothetical protein
MSTKGQDMIFQQIAYLCVCFFLSSRAAGRAYQRGGLSGDESGEEVTAASKLILLPSHISFAPCTTIPCIDSIESRYNLTSYICTSKRRGKKTPRVRRKGEEAETGRKRWRRQRWSLSCSVILHEGV